MTVTSANLTVEQQTIIKNSHNVRTFLEGPPGAGKTTVGINWIVNLLKNGISGRHILLLVPQRTLAAPYYEILQSADVPAGSAVTIVTIGGLARRMIDLFWPLVAEQANFQYPDRPPIFLTLETAQYYMAYLVRPLIENGYFDSITIDRNRIYSQILDNLNKAASVGFNHTEIGQRLITAWVGDTTQTRVYDNAQECANIFREFCLANNFLDFSLQLELFKNELWPLKLCHDYLTNEYHHLISDNIEENIPISADILGEWLPDTESALLIYDQDGGYRQFLAADPAANYDLIRYCEDHALLSENYVSSQEISQFGISLSKAILPTGETNDDNIPESKNINLPIYHTPLDTKYHPEMLDWVTNEIINLIDSGCSPGEIVVLAPYLSDSLRYSLAARLTHNGIPSRSHRPSRALKEEPASQCLLTLATLAHPHWGLKTHKSDIAYALIQAIEGLDLIRSQILVNCVYKNQTLGSFDDAKSELQERITYLVGGRYEILRDWLITYGEVTPLELDLFLSRLFGEVLSQPGFGFHTDYNASAIAANLIESIRKFRWAVGDVLPNQNVQIGHEYIQMVKDGVIAAQYLGSWSDQPEDAVYLAPAYTFLMSNRAVDVQFWLDVGSRGWYERLYQPLTHPHVLSRHWVDGSPWTDADEFATNTATLNRLVLGLVRRCRESIYLGLSGINEQGYEQKGDLLRAIDQALRKLS